ncbi:MAG: ATP-binding protein [Clostridia bacterium]
MNFHELIGQKAVIQSLKNSIESNRVNHAYIFEGPSGIGKRTIASVFSTALTCETGYAEPCDLCRSCIKNRNNNHPDVKILDEQGSSLGIDMVRALQKDIYIKPYEAGRKIYIIPEAERMTIQAQNGLLKILEEPPSYAIIIMTITNSAVLLDTIVSRSMLIRFRIHSYSEIEEYLKRSYPEIKDEIPFVALFSGGIIGRANQLAASQEFKKVREEMVEIVSMLLNTDELRVINAASYFIEHKNDIDMILDFLVLWFRDILLIKELCSDKMVINIDMDNMLRHFTQKVSSYTACRIIQILLETKKRISMNANYALAIESMLIQGWEEIHGKRSRSTI